MLTNNNPKEDKIFCYIISEKCKLEKKTKKMNLGKWGWQRNSHQAYHPCPMTHCPTEKTLFF